jgi:hypothetical protein
MKNRIADYLPAAWRPKTGQSKEAGFSSQDLQAALEPVEQVVTKYPAAALAVAFAAGVALAWWIKRK